MAISQHTKILITGVGGPAAIAAIKALLPEHIDIFGGDIDPHAAGFQLLPANRRLLLPTGVDPRFAHYLHQQCISLGIDVLLPTVDAELRPLAAIHGVFSDSGIRVMLSSLRSLELCLDKWKLLESCAGAVPLPDTQLLTEHLDMTRIVFPVLVKPRSGSGGRGIMVIHTPEELKTLDHSGKLLVQQYLPGEEYSVDVLALGNQTFAVPRVRLKVDSGVAVAAQTLHNALLERLGCQAATQTGITGVCNVQFKRDNDGTPRLLEINPRLPGTMPLTIAAGVNMPLLWLQATLGQKVNLNSLSFTEVAMVRTWEEHFFQPQEFSRFLSAPQ